MTQLQRNLLSGTWFISSTFQSCLALLWARGRGSEVWLCCLCSPGGLALVLQEAFGSGHSYEVWGGATQHGLVTNNIWPQTWEQLVPVPQVWEMTLGTFTQGFGGCEQCGSCAIGEGQHHMELTLQFRAHRLYLAAGSNWAVLFHCPLWLSDFIPRRSSADAFHSS